MNSETKFWFQQPSILLENSKISQFFPTNKMNYIEKLNSIMRLAIYFSIIFYILKRDYKIIFVIIFVSLTTIYIYYFENANIKKATEIKEIFNNYKISGNNIYFPKNINLNKNKIKKCIEPSVENPFMNRNMFENDIFPNAASCPSYEKLSDFKENSTLDFNITSENKNKTIGDITNENFNLNLYKDVSDIFNRNNSQREYYTMPVTTNPNHQTDFANWLYKTPMTCKDGNGYQCVANNANIVNSDARNLELRYQ